LISELIPILLLSTRRQKRQAFSLTIKRQVIHSQDGKCANCKRRVTKQIIEFHHKNNDRSNNKLKPYEIALNEIDFSEIAKEKIIEFIRKQLKVVIKHGNNESSSLIVRNFGTIWKGVRANYKDLNYPTKERFTIYRNEQMKLESRSKFILQVGIYDAYVIGADGKRLSIHKGGNVLTCQNIPSGEYDLLIKTEYEPSNDNTADFIDRIKII
jgi:hypothetical protein